MLKTTFPPDDRPRQISASELTALIDALPAHVALLDSEGHILVVNQAWRRFAGANMLLNESFCVGENYIEVCARAQGDCADEAHQAAEGIREILAGRSQLFEIDYPCHSPNEQRWFRMCVTPTSGSNHSRAVVTHNNVTDLVLAEMERASLDARLEEARHIEALGQLTGGVAHHFDNLLTVIIQNSEALTDRLMDSRSREMVEATLEAAGRADQLTARLSSFAQRQLLAPEAVDINKLMPGMSGVLRRTLPATVDIVFQPAAGLWPVHVDPTQLQRAIASIAANAAGAMPNGGSLTITTANVTAGSPDTPQRDDARIIDHVMLAITDTGCGMDADTLKQAIVPFFTTRDDSDGLGLSMTYGFARQSNGHLAINSEPQRGTSVRLYFPRLLNMT